MIRYSNRTAARKLGIHFVTLQRYIAAKKIPVPKGMKVGDVTVRAWSEQDVERVRKILPKIANGRKTRYQKQKSKPQGKKPVPQKKKH